MHCLTCSYPLAEITTGECPECGRRFNPAAPRTWGAKGHARLTRRLWWFAVLAAPGVLWCELMLHFTFLVAWMQLGRKPRVSLDDPKQIGVLVSVFMVATWLAMAGAPVLMVGTIVSSVAGGRLQRRWRPWIWPVIATLLSVPSWYALTLLNPYRDYIGEWFAD